VKNTTTGKKFARHSLPALVAMGGSLAAIPAAALELGELTVHSHLGQPLRASIAFALGPGERLSDSCVALRSGQSASGLPGVGQATVSVASGSILLAGNTAVREPMVSAQIVVNCPYSANLSREYMLFVDPATPAYEAPTVTQQLAPEAELVAVAPAAIEPVRKDIAKSTRYRVRPGDSVSEIAQRIENRNVGLWPAVEAIFTANPDAFVNNDPNRLKAGSWLTIPSFDGNVSVVTAPSATEVVADMATAAESTSSTIGEVYEPETVAIATATAPAEPRVTTNDLKPGDIVLDDNPFVAPAGSSENILIPDTSLDAPATISTSPNVPVAILSTDRRGGNDTSSVSWISWLAGSAIVLIAGLLMFGRRLRGHTGGAPLAATEPRENRRRSTDDTSDKADITESSLDHDLSDDSPTEENLALDADLILGTGLEGASDSSLSKDFGFAAATALDIELPFEPLTPVSEKTDILPPVRMDERSILDSEVMPEDDYDMSVIVDTTKVPQTEDATERDLKAVEVTADDDTSILDSYTITKEIDYRVLEQDYEDEFTETQALNKEISRAAAELGKRVGSETADTEATMALPLATVTSLDVTAQMPAKNDDVSDLTDVGINETNTAINAGEDDTVEMPVESEKAS